jgi:hypothetical protein
MGKEILKDEILEVVTGGVGGDVNKNKTFEERKKEFESAWKKLKMDTKGISGMKMAELFDEWENSESEVDAMTFLTTV